MLTLTKTPAVSNGAISPDYFVPRSMTAAEISGVVGRMDLEEARRHHVEMATVVAELAQDAEMSWPWTHDDPTVALLRALARISIVAPRSTSRHATSLMQHVGVRRSADSTVESHVSGVTS